MHISHVMRAGILAIAAAGMAAAPAGAQSTASDLRNVRYCEIIPSVQTGAVVTSYVYNTLGWNDCPADLWRALTEEQVNREYGSQSAVLNGPRYWVIDRLVGSGATASGQEFTFGGIKMSLRAKLEVPAGTPTVGERFYAPNRVRRETTYGFDKGKLIYKLTDPDGNVYVMQSYAQIVAPTLTIKRLRNLGRRLRLPEGWSYSTRRLRHDMTLTAAGLAYVVNDNLANSYQRMARPVAKLTSSCSGGTRKVAVEVGGDTALTRVTAGARLLRRTTASSFEVAVPARALRGGGTRITAVARNDAGTSRASMRVRPCG